MAENDPTSQSSGQEPQSPQPSVSGTEPAETGPAAAAGSVDAEARKWAMMCHFAGLAGLLPVVPGLGSVVAPLIVWQLKKDLSAFVDEHGKEAVNFQISMLIYAVVSALLIFACIGIVLLPAVVIFDVVLALVAGVKANNGERYHYPLTIRFIK